MTGDIGEESDNATESADTLTTDQVLQIAIKSLEHILEEMPEIQFPRNQLGEELIVEKQTTEETLHRLYQLAVQTRGTIDDYVALGRSFIQQALNEEDNHDKFRQAYDTFNKVPEDQHDESIISYLMFTALQLWLLTQQKPDLEKAYQHAQRLFKEYEGLEANHYHSAGRVYVEKAENDETLTLDQKIEMLKKGINYQRTAVQEEQNEITHYHLAEAIATYLDHCTDSQEKQQLKTEAIHHLKKAYELDDDPRILDAIKEMEAA